MNNSGLFTDLYELTMAATYFEEGRKDEMATFDLFVRRLPVKRNYLVFAGLPATLEYLKNVHFDQSAIEYLKSLKLFSEDFLSYLQDFSFSGDIESLEEGEVFFAGEPIIKVTAPIIEAQIIETALINIVHIHTLIASKASRVVSAAGGVPVIDFGARRSHGSSAAKAAAYASYLTGGVGTSNLSAGKDYNIPVFGTMAHSFVQTFDSEEDAFVAYMKSFPANNTLLIDTYDAIAGAKKVVAVAKRLPSIPITAVRIDSGDLGGLSHKVRKILNDGGLQQTKIFLSGDLDEYAITTLSRKSTPVDGYGVGTNMDASKDEPTLEVVYKLSQLENDKRIKMTMKWSPGKKNMPGRKQLLRVFSKGLVIKDVIGLESETLPGVPLLHMVMKKGQLLGSLQSWEDLRKDFTHRLKQFSPEMLLIDTQFIYPVHVSKGLQQALKDKK